MVDSANVEGGIEALTSLSGALPILGLLAMYILAFLVWHRTASNYSLLARLWQIFHGDKEHKDSPVSDFFHEQSVLMQFRFITGVRARTLKQAQALIAWARMHNEDVGAIATCGRYFDIEKVGLKEEEELPKNWHLVCRLGLVLALLATTLAFTGLAGWNEALLLVKKSGTPFSLSSDYARPIGFGMGISRSQCIDGKALPKNAFATEDAEVICELLRAANLNRYLEQTMLWQRIGFGFITLIWIAYLWTAFVWLRQGGAARDMLNRIRPKENVAPSTIVAQES
ncbi:DUF6216 family protein [Chitinimonas sp. JJ19]|uniref:DUF6216 family protein n=1 Tax=Chitinimonas sp. JJ19 TaxID=3109352 RepID=UPI0030029904